MGALVPAMGERGLVNSNDRYCARQLVGLLRIRLGRMVGMGPGRKSTTDHVAFWHGVNPLSGGD